MAGGSGRFAAAARYFGRPSRGAAVARGAASIHRLEPALPYPRKHPRVNVEQKALQNEPTCTARLGDPGKGHEIGEREAHDLGLDPFESPLGLVARGQNRGLADLDPGSDEVPRLS